MRRAALRLSSLSLLSPFPYYYKEDGKIRGRENANTGLCLFLVTDQASLCPFLLLQMAHLLSLSLSLCVMKSSADSPSARG